MKVLAVETATSWQSVAILDDDRVLARCDQNAAGSHARLLLPAVDKLFSQTGLGPAKLDGLVVSIGPGSFTGLRVGLSTVLGFRTITRVPLAVVPTLEGMAWSLRASNERLCPVLNSRRGELYWAIFQWQGRDRLDRLTPEQVGSVETLAKQLSGSVMMFGEGWETERAAEDAFRIGSSRQSVSGPGERCIRSAAPLQPRDQRGVRKMNDRAVVKMYRHFRTRASRAA